MRGRWGPRLRLTAATVGVLVVVVPAQLLLARQSWRLDLTPERQYTLSAHSRSALAGLEGPVRITAFVRSDDPRNRDLRDLLERVRRASPRVTDAMIDINRHPHVARRFGVDVYGGVVVESGGRRKVVSHVGEDRLIGAILSVARTRQPVVYWLRGHGERDPTDTNRRHGYSIARTVLEHEGYTVRPLDVGARRTVPADAAVVIVAAPQRPFPPQESVALDQYVDAGGRLLVLAEPSGARAVDLLLARVGIRASSAVVVDPDNRLAAGEHLTIRVPEVARGHRVTSVLEVAPVLSEVGPIDALGAGRPDVRVVPLLRTGPGSWATSDAAVLRTGRGPFVPGRDRHGPLTAGPARAIVIGDADFASNLFIERLGNRDLLVNAVDWLAGQESLIAVRHPRKVPGREQFFLSARQERSAFALAAALPLFFFCLGTWKRWRG